MGYKHNNNGKGIKGYRDLSKEEIELMNKCKELAEEVGSLCDEVRMEPTTDPRWLKEAQLDLQKRIYVSDKINSKTDYILGLTVSYISEDGHVFEYKTKITDKEKAIEKGFSSIIQKGYDMYKYKCNKIMPITKGEF